MSTVLINDFSSKVNFFVTEIIFWRTTHYLSLVLQGADIGMLFVSIIKTASLLTIRFVSSVSFHSKRQVFDCESQPTLFKLFLCCEASGTNFLSSWSLKVQKEHWDIFVFLPCHKSSLLTSYSLKLLDTTELEICC